MSAALRDRASGRRDGAVQREAVLPGGASGRYLRAWFGVAFRCGTSVWRYRWGAAGSRYGAAAGAAVRGGVTGRRFSLVPRQSALSQSARLGPQRLESLFD